jgi:hypothetical protein
VYMRIYRRVACGKFTESCFAGGGFKVDACNSIWRVVSYASKLNHGIRHRFALEKNCAAAIIEDQLDKHSKIDINNGGKTISVKCCYFCSRFFCFEGF